MKLVRKTESEGDLAENREQRAIAGLKRLMSDGSLQPGSRIPENAVAQSLGLSRTPMRSAIGRSSAAVFGSDADYDHGLVNDRSQPLPGTHYGAFKLCNELNAKVYWQDQKFSSVGLRPMTVYGPGRDVGLTSSPTRALAAAVLALAALGALSLAVLAFIRPLETATTEDLPYTQSGVFSYTASAPAGLYDAGTAQTGEPIFRKLMNQLQLRFSYTASADEPHQLAGSYRMLAEISAADGWKRSVELLPTSQFTGEHFATQARLNLDDIQALIDAMEQQTGLIHQHYTLALVPEVTLSGTLGGQALHDTFAPRLEFQLSALELQQQRDSTRSDDPLAPSQKGLIKRTQASPATLGVFGLALDAGLTRWLATIAAVLAGGTAVALSIKLAMANSTNEPARIRRQYGQLLVAVNDSDLSDTDHVVDVATIADLVRIADRDERMILYTRRGAVHYYMVPIAGVNYQYRSVDAVAALAIETERHES